MVTQKYQRIMVAIDGSEGAEIAFKKAVEIALRNDGDLVIAHVVDTYSFQTFTNFESRITNEDFLEQLHRLANNTLDAYEKYANSQGLDRVEKVLKNGSPKIEIADTLPSSHAIDLLVLGATGMNAFTRLFIGSVSEYVVRHAPCDVLIVRSKDVEHTRINIDG